MKNILIPIEFEFHAPRLIDTGLKIAKKFDSKVWLLHIAASEPDFIGYDVGPQYIRDNRAETLKSERILIQKFANMMQDEGVDAKGWIFEGSPSKTILSEMERLNIDLVIIGHHHQNWLQKITGGGTDTEIVEKGGVPVLIIPI